MESSSSEVSMESQQFIPKKRRGRDLQEEDTPPKRVKLRDLESVFRSEGMASHYPGSSKTKSKAQFGTIEKEVSQFTQKSLYPNSRSMDEERPYRKSSTLEADQPVLVSLDLNSEVHIIENSACIEIIAKTKDSAKRSFDLNEDTCSTVNLVQFYPSFKTCTDTKPKDTWECRSSTGPMVNASLKKWAEMKQNGFISPNYGSIPTTHKQRGRKSKAEVLKRKIEQARKEQVDRFAKIAAPSGLLKGLNLGIINHVRNSKQVHSIIKALVSERGDKNKDKEDVDSFIHQSNLPYGNASCKVVLGSKYVPDYHLMSKDAHAFPYEERKVGYKYDDPLALKLSSSAVMVSENCTSLSMEESMNAENVDSLSVKAANVASQWVQLLHQDIQGRLHVLKCSKKRVQHVITTELPSLLSKELPSKQGNDFLDTSGSITPCSKETVELHQISWIALFCKMEQRLCKEENELETQLNQVNNMIAQCEKGFCNKAFGLTLPGASGKGGRSGMEEADGEMAMKAAAASIYSTCSFALSMANVKCC